MPPQAEGTVGTSRRSARLSTQPSVSYEDLDSDPSPAVPTIPLPPRTAKAAATAKSAATVSGPGRGRAKKYIIKHYFDNKTCHALSQGYSQAVYNNIDKGVEGQSIAVMAVIWHQLDHPESTAAEERYHQYCTEKCPYQQWISSGNSGNNFIRRARLEMNKKKFHLRKHSLVELQAVKFRNGCLLRQEERHKLN